MATDDEEAPEPTREEIDRLPGAVLLTLTRIPIPVDDYGLCLATLAIGYLLAGGVKGSRNVATHGVGTRRVTTAWRLVHFPSLTHVSFPIVEL